MSDVEFRSSVFGAVFGKLYSRAEGNYCSVGSPILSDRSRSPTPSSSDLRACIGAAARFFAKFADKIVQLQKETLRDVVMSNQANRYVEWMHALIFLGVSIPC